MVLGELLCVCYAEFGVVAVASFGDVVEQGSKIEDVWLGKAVHECGQGWLFVAVLFHG